MTGVSLSVDRYIVVNIDYPEVPSFGEGSELHRVKQFPDEVLGIVAKCVSATAGLLHLLLSGGKVHLDATLTCR